jgi:hypothetical protein
MQFVRRLEIIELAGHPVRDPAEEEATMRTITLSIAAVALLAGATFAQDDARHRAKFGRNTPQTEARIKAERDSTAYRDAASRPPPRLVPPTPKRVIGRSSVDRRPPKRLGSMRHGRALPTATRMSIRQSRGRTGRTIVISRSSVARPLLARSKFDSRKARWSAIALFFCCRVLNF